MPRVQLPDGNIGEFPDSMSNADIEAVLQKQFPSQNATPRQPDTVMAAPAPSQRERFLNPELYPVGDTNEPIGQSLKNIAQRGGVGVFQLADALAHPARTVGSLLSSVLPEQAVQGVNRVAGRPILPANVPNPIQTAYEQVAPGGLKAVGNVAPTVGQIIAGGALGEALPAIASDVKTGVPKVARTLGGAGKNTARQLVEDVTNSNAKAEADAQAANAEAVQKHSDAVHKAIDDANKEYQKASEKHALAVQGEVGEAQGEYAKATQKHADAVQDAVNKARAQYEEDLAKNLKERQKVQKQNEQAVADFQAKSAQEAKIAPTQAKLDQATSDLRAGIETARNNALKKGNEKYSAVNQALDPYEADPEKIRVGLADATESISGDKMPPIIKDLTDRLEGPVKGMEPMTYDELQGYYSKLGQQISTGTIRDGEVFHAYDVMHEAIGDEMQRIANEHGLGKQLQDARNYWRRMKQTFGKPYSATDAATAALKGINPDFLTMDTQANRLRLLGSFDSRLPGLAQHVQNLQAGLDALPKPTPARVLTKNLAEATKAPPALPSAPDLSRLETPSRPIVTDIRSLEFQTPPRPPNLSNLPEAPDRPATVEPQTNVITPESLEQANRESIAAREKKARTGYSPLLTAVSMFDALRNAIGGNWTAVGRDLAARGAYEAGKQGYAALLRNPTVVDFLSKPTAEQIAQIPPELRGPGLQPILDAAKKQGVKVDPRIYAIAGVTPPKKRVAAALTK
jgi:hypothetical protein